MLLVKVTINGNRRKESLEISPYFHAQIVLAMSWREVRVGLHYGGEGLRSVKNARPRHGYTRQMVDVPEKN